MADHVMGNSARRSYGYSENTGSWSIDLGRLDADSVEALNRMADNAIQAFRQAFADVCTVEYAEGDLVEIGENHQVSNLWAEVPLEQDPDGRFRPAPDAGPTNAANRAGLSRVLFTCGVEVEGYGT